MGVFQKYELWWGPSMTLQCLGMFNYAQLNFPESTGISAHMHLHRHILPSTLPNPGCIKGSCSPDHIYF